MKNFLVVPSWLLGLFLCIAVPAPLQSAERVMMASLSPGLFEFPVVVSLKRGFFRDEGLEVLKVQM
jgi:hypothetical protein